MLGIGSGSFDPETLVILETAFDEAWITLKTNGSGTSGRMSSRDESAIWRSKESAIPCDCMIERLGS
jgi:hypothetical protein